MNRKITAILLTAVIALCAGGCGSKTENAGTKETGSAAAIEANDETKKPDSSEETVKKFDSAAEWEVVSSGVATQKNSIGITWYSAWMEVKNTGNVPLYLDTVDMDMETANGQMAGKISLMSAYPQVLLPGEVGVYYDSSSLDDGAETEGLKLHGRPDAKKAEIDCIRYDVKDVTVKSDDFFGTKILGRIENNTDEDSEDMIYVAALCYGDDGKFLTSMFTVVDSVPAADYAGFEMVCFGYEVEADDIAETIVFAYPYQFQF